MDLPAPALLIVDDEDANRRLYAAILKDCGADLRVAAHGAQALLMCAGQEFAMILLDVHLTDMSGFEVARRLREAQPPVAAPIVFVSAVYTHREDAFRGYDLGAVDYLLSPVVPAILRAKAAVFIGLQRMHNEALAQRAAVERAYRELRSAHTELEHFSYSASHDLRTPLSQISGFAELVAMRGGEVLDAKSKGYLAQVAAAARRMNALIDDLLTLSRLTGGVLDPVPVDLSALAREIAAEIDARAPDRTVDWELAAGLRALGNPGLLRAALANLLGNAWKYSAESRAPRIEFGSLVQGEATVYFVADNGAGFDAEAAADRLFRPFQRFHSPSKFEGTGIGLSIVQRVIVKHGGDIRVESKPGEGARFLFTLPLPSQPRAETAGARP